MNYIKKMMLLTIVIGSSFFIISGCVNSDKNRELEDFMIKFETIYSEIAESMDRKKPLQTLKNIKTKENQDKINELKVLLENIEDKMPANKRELYATYRKNYEGLIFLSSTSLNDWELLPLHKKRAIKEAIVRVEIMTR